MRQALLDAREQRSELAIATLERTVRDAVTSGDLVHLGTVTRCLAVVLENRGDIDGARSCLEQAVALTPNDGRTLYHLARMWERSGDTDKARSLTAAASKAARKNGDTSLIDLIQLSGDHPEESSDD